MKEINRKDVGAIVARFMVNQLHDAHKNLIQSVYDRHERVLIFLGVSPLRNTLNAPLDFKHRKAMILEDFPNAEIYHIDDNRSNKVWSNNLDRQVSKWIAPGLTITLYGSRDSFLKHYEGSLHTCELESEIFISGSQVRKSIITSYPSSKDFRAGMIAATGEHYPTAYQTVDIAVMNKDHTQMLLVKKPNEKHWRFIGGFSDPTSNSLEDDAKREVKEETGVEISDPIYIGSSIINDWRYRSEKSKIKTALFYADYVSGTPEGADDVEAAKWFDVDKLFKDDIVPEHHVLYDMVATKVKFTPENPLQ